MRKVESVDVAETAITLADRGKISADIIVAADGLHVGDDTDIQLEFGRLMDCSLVRCQVLCTG